MGVLIASPIKLIIVNSNNCLETGFERESGYVHKRFQVKLLATAATNEITLAVTAETKKNPAKRLKIPKSTTDPTTPTIAKRINLPRSLALVKINVMLFNAYYPLEIRNRLGNSIFQTYHRLPA